MCTGETREVEDVRVGPEALAGDDVGDDSMTALAT
jgi:hypothetical protein